jgi:hypothetical protein
MRSSAETFAKSRGFVPVPLSGSVRCRCPGSVQVPLSRCCSRLILRRSYEEAVKPLDRARSRRPHRVDRSAVWRRAPLADHDHTHTSEDETSTCRDVVAVHDRISAADEKWIQAPGITRFQVCPFSDPFQIRFRSVSDPLDALRRRLQCSA